MEEVKIVNEFGEALSRQDLLSPEFIKNMPQEQLEAAAYTAVKELKKPIKNIEDEVKRRLKEGHQFEHITMTQSNRSAIDQSEATKKALVNKYGWDAVDAKSPTQLKKKYGESIDDDLQKVTVYSTIDRVKYE